MRAVIFLATMLFPAAMAAQHVNPNLDCRIRSEPINFGAYDPLGTNQEMLTGRVELRCPHGAVPAMKVTLSTGASGDFFDRTMLSGPDALHYNLFADPERVRLVGDGSDGTLPLAAHATLPLGLTVFTFYGVVAPRQNVPPGEYSDNIEVEVTF